jgi:uncharacterized membrane protein
MTTTIIAVFALALLLGGMIFFTAVVAPLVFTKLPAKQAGTFIRAVFPVYYLYVLAASVIAALALATRWDGAVMAGVAALTVWLRQGLMPRINRLSDAAQAGDNSAKRRFDMAHRMSVALNIAEIIVTCAVLARVAA